MMMQDRFLPPLQAHAEILCWAIERLCGALDETSLSQLLEKISLQHLAAGEILYRQGDPGEQMHVVLSGRLQVRVMSSEGEETIVAHPQPGDIVGEMAVFSGSARAATICAVRDTALGAIDRKEIETLAARFPQVLSNVARMIIGRLTGSTGHLARRTGIRTIMLIPLQRGGATEGFGAELRTALLRFGSVLHLDAQAADRRLGAGRPNWRDYGRHLDACEKAHDYLLLEADPQPGLWNRICLAHADKILLVADTAAGPEMTAPEQQLLSDAPQAVDQGMTDLILIHSESAVLPDGTRHWLARRRIGRHHHVRHGCASDIARVARIITGHAVSLVLAGGGARGFAHLGVIRALGEAGIAIDAVGGASFGALAAAGIARGLSDAESLEEQRRAFTLDDPLGDYTFPVMSLVRGEHLERILQQRLPMDIEDLWLPFFAVSSSLTTGQVNVHETGPLWRTIRASVSLPAILPPSLQDGQLLIDGGVLDNLPVDVMRKRIHGQIIAVDLAVDQDSHVEHHSIPSAMDYLKSLLVPGRPLVEAPTISRVIMQITTMASRREAGNARKLADLYLNPPLGSHDFLDWNSMRQIADIGYRHALPRIREWLRQQPQLKDPAGFIRALQHRMPA